MDKLLGPLLKKKEAALRSLNQRRQKAQKEGRLNNASLYAGSPMYFYCKVCGLVSDILPENYSTPPKRLCDECKTLKDLCWIE